MTKASLFWEQLTFHGVWIQLSEEGNFFHYNTQNIIFFRFERRIYIPLPDHAARMFLFKNQLKKTPNSLNEEDYDYLSTNTEGFIFFFLYN